MGEIKTHFDNTDRFKDISMDELELEFPEEEIVAGHRFQHSRNGVYLADPFFEVGLAELGEILVNYRDIELICLETDSADAMPFGFSNCTVIGGCSSDVQMGVDFAADLLSCTDREGSKIKITDVLPDWEELDFAGRLQKHGFREHLFREKWEKEGLPPAKTAFCLSGEIPDVTEDICFTKPKVIKFYGCVGYMVEEGIYYFGGKGGSESRRNRRYIYSADFGEKPVPVDMAVIGHARDFHPTPWIYIDYVAFDKKYYPRLFELMREVSEYDEDTYYTEFEAKDTGFGLSRGGAEAARDAAEDCSDGRAESEKQPVIEEGAEELLSGKGFRQVQLAYKMVFADKRRMRCYEAAYKLGDYLVLVERAADGCKKEKHNLKLVQQLYVREERVLNCGIKYSVIHKVVDCGDEKWKELMTPEAYAIFAEE